MKHKGYQDLQDEIFKLTLLDENDEEGLNNDVYIAATKTIEVFDQKMDASILCIFKHGRDSIVFQIPEYSDTKEIAYLTISATQVSTLVSTSKKIINREDFFLDDFLNLLKNL